MIFNSQGDADAIAGFINGQTITPGDEEIILPARSLLLGDVTIAAADTEAAYQEGYAAGYAEGQAAAYYSKELQYIESSGTQYIDTGFKPNQDTRVEISIEMEIPNACCVYGSRISSSNSNFSVWLSTPNNVSCRFGAEAKETSFTIDSKIEIDQNKNITTVNGTVVTNTESTFQSTYPIFLFTLNDAGNYRSDRMTSGKLYSCKIYDNGTLIRDYIPVIDNSGAACLYDKIAKQLYHNAGSGSFSYAE